MNIKNWKIGTRLGGAFALLIGLLVVCVWFGIASLRLLNGGTAQIVHEDYPKAVLAYETLDVVNRSARAMRNMLLWDKPEEVEKERQTVLQNRQENSAHLDKLAVLIKSEQGQARLKTVLDARAVYGASQQSFMDLVAAGKKEEATAWLLTRIRKDQREYFDAVRALVRFQDARVLDSGAHADARTKETIHPPTRIVRRERITSNRRTRAPTRHNDLRYSTRSDAWGTVRPRASAVS